MNMPLQGTASDIIKIAMIRVYNAIKKLNLKSQLILQIHDELIIDVYPGENKKIIEILKNEMENATKLAVPLIISVGEGKNLYKCLHFFSQTNYDFLFAFIKIFSFSY